MGWRSVAWGLEHISAEELCEWQAYERLEPFGTRQEDLRFGYLLSLLANIHRGKNATLSRPWSWFHSLAELAPQGMSAKDPRTWEAVKKWAQGMAGKKASPAQKAAAQARPNGKRQKAKGKRQK